ncbi:hypothetical protein [Natrinema gelatinilyticum]|uniref:hypothetical protein n=1 Tax=Natrinema gelatinilyticum TaxID=2961571 RepID=UPI0020C213D1|nr:hypothetical protein [Natrinema gelatinilyticum]
MEPVRVAGTTVSRFTPIGVSSVTRFDCSGYPSIEIGFGTSDGAVIDDAIATAEDGYEMERNRY